MTTTPTPSVSQIIPTGTSVGPWPTGFTYEIAADVRVCVSLDGIDGPDLTLNADYGVTGANPTVDGGSVTLDALKVPSGGWTAGHRVYVRRETARRQSLALPDTEGHKPRATERGLDRAMRIAEEDRDHRARALILPLGQTGGTVPWAAGLGERFVTIGADGRPQANVRPQDFEILSALQKDAGNLYTDAERATARAGLGVQRASKLEAETGTADDRSMTPLRAMQAARVLVEWINPREKQYAGGAPMNGVDDDAPAFRAALAYAKTLGSRFEGGAAKIKSPRGRPRFDTPDPTATDRVMNARDANNILIEGEGQGATQWETNGNWATIRSDDLVASPLFRFGVRDLTIRGFGYDQTNADGIELGPNNNCHIDNVRFYANRKALAYRDSFHSRFTQLQMNGQGGYANYDAFYAKEGTLSQPENAVEISGGQVFGAKRYGFRGECITGTKVFGLEVLGCENVGVYLGESPNGKDLKWFSWVGGLIDTCPDLLVIRKGSASVAQYIHLSGLWCGYAYEGPPGAGVAVDFSGLTDCTFSADMLVNCIYAANLQDCDRVYFGARTISEYDRLAQGATGIIVNNTRHSRIDIGTMRKATGSPATTALIEQGTANHNLITGVFDGAVTTIGAQSNKAGCIVY